MISEIIAIGTGISAFGLLALTMAKYSGESSFLYANARLVTRKIVDRKKLENMLYSTSLLEFVGMMKDTEYADILEGVSDVNKLNIALEKGFIKSIYDVKEVAPKKFKRVFEAYLKIYEAKIIKLFFRSRKSKIEIDQEMIHAIEEANPSLSRRLAETKTIADMGVALGKYPELFEKKSIEEFDSEIDRITHLEIEEMLTKAKFNDKREIMEIFNRRDEIRKILTEIKKKIRKGEHDMEEMVERYKKTEFYPALKKGLEESMKEESYFFFEKELWKYHLETTSSKDIGKPIGPYPLISYITKKEIELKNIMIIAKGIMSSSDKEKVKEMII